MENIDLVLASDNRAYCGLLIAACTAASCADRNAQLVFHILDGGIEDLDFSFFESCLLKCSVRVKVDRIHVSQEVLSCCPSYHGSQMAYARLLLPKLLPNVSRVIYFDTDFYWNADVVQLWNETRDIVSIAATEDQTPSVIVNEREWYEKNNISIPNKPYFCTGLCVINLDRWRTDSTMERAFDFLRKHPTVGCADQTALNAVLKQEDVQILPVCWDRFSRWVTPEEFLQPLAIHFAGDAPWNASRSTKMLTDAQLLWFKADAKLRGTSVWRSLRCFYSVLVIIQCRIVYILIMKIPLCRCIFHWLMKRAGRCFFDERI